MVLPINQKHMKLCLSANNDTTQEAKMLIMSLKNLFSTIVKSSLRLRENIEKSKNIEGTMTIIDIYFDKEMKNPTNVTKFHTIKQVRALFGAGGKALRSFGRRQIQLFEAVSVDYCYL